MLGFLFFIFLIVGFASGPIDNFRDPSDGALSGQDSWSVDYGQKL